MEKNIEEEVIIVSNNISIWIDTDLDLTIEDNFGDQLWLKEQEAIKLAEAILIHYKIRNERKY